jgi:AraC-like DNA-binding protein
MLRPAEPAPQLKPFVRKYAQLEVSTSNSLVTWPIPARSIPCIEFTFGDPYRVRHIHGSLLEIARPAVLIGAKTYQRIQLESKGHVETFTVLFQSTGLQRLFSLPGGVLVNEHYEADSVLGSCFAALHTELGEAKSFGRRLQIADRFFSRFIPRLDARHGLEAAMGAMISRQGCLRVQALADGMGLSLRQFERRFTDHVGIGPKVYARILRFEAAIHKKSISSLNWTSVAHELGYCDQAHMIHDFQSLSGESPSQLAPYFELLGSICADFRVRLDRPSHSGVAPTTANGEVGAFS